MIIPILTIDGPSGAGKGTISRAVAKKLGWNYLDSGVIYRALSIATLNNKTKISNIEEIATIARSLALEFEDSADGIVKLNNKDITNELITTKIGNTASTIAAYAKIREILLQKQRDFQRPPGLVADGRDMGTVVFSQATNKVFLTASYQQRAKRRYKQLIEQGIYASLEEVSEEIKLRDRRDKERKIAPLKMAKGALYIDSSDLSITQVINKILHLVANH